MRRKNFAMLVAAGLVVVFTTAASGGCGGSTAASPAGGGTMALPAEKGGTCGIGPHTIENVHGIVSGRLDWTCQGSVVLTMNVRLVYLGNNAERETEVDEGSPLIVNSPPNSPPRFVTAPCTTGLWKMKIVGTEVPAAGPELTFTTSNVAGPPFDNPEWQTPTQITC